MKGALVCIIGICVAVALNAATAASKGVTIGLSVDRHECPLGDEIILRAEMANKGDRPLYVYNDLGWGELGGFSLILKKNGEIIHPKFLDHDMIAPSTLSDSLYYSRLEVGEFLGVYRMQKIDELVTSPGTYSITISYKSPVPLNVSKFKRDFVSREDGSIFSNSISILVTDGK